jgi:hypothetical protein
MFARIKKSGKYQYLQIVENKKVRGKVKQRVIATVGRMDRLNAKGALEPLVRSLSRFSEEVLLVLSSKGDVKANARKIGPALIFERLWNQLGIKQAIRHSLRNRKFEFDVERAIFLTVLHRLFASGSDRSCEKWRRDYVIRGVESLELHHLYRAMAFLGEPLKDQTEALCFAPRCIKDEIEEHIFSSHRDLFTGLDLVFFDTTSIYFEGNGGQTLGKHGHSKDHRPDLKQMVVGAVIDDNGRPICCEMWPGNTADVKTLIPIADRLRKRFHIGRFCIVADRGMVSASTLEELESPEHKLLYILGTRMRKVNRIKQDILSRGGRYKEVYPEGIEAKDPAPLKVKEVWEAGERYIVCLNTKQVRKDVADRQAILDNLEQRIWKGPKAMIGNKGYRKYLKVSHGSVSIDAEKVKTEARFDGKLVLRTNTDLTAEEVALEYKELWQVEHVFREMKSILDTRPIFHKRDETIRGHVFCSFLALAMRKELYKLLEQSGYDLEWSDIKQDLEALQETTIEDNGKCLAVRTQCIGTCSKVFQAARVAIPPTIREITSCA